MNFSFLGDHIIALAGLFPREDTYCGRVCLFGFWGRSWRALRILGWVYNLKTNMMLQYYGYHHMSVAYACSETHVLQRVPGLGNVYKGLGRNRRKRLYRRIRLTFSSSGGLWSHFLPFGRGFGLALQPDCSLDAFFSHASEILRESGIWFFQRDPHVSNMCVRYLPGEF